MAQNRESDGDTVFFEQEKAQPPPPKGFSQQFAESSNKFFGRFWSSATVALLRVFWNPPTAPPPPSAESLPKWYLDDYQRKSRFTSYGRQYLRDTVLLTAATYVMEGVENGSKAIRGGKDDPLNKIMGGIAAGGMMGYAWFPQRYPARVIMTSTGALVGYISYVAEKTSKAVLLEQQRKLEKEVTGASDERLHKELDPDFLRDLIRRRQKQLVEAAEAIRAGGGTGPAKPGVPSWVLGQDNGQGPSSSQQGAPQPPPTDPGVWGSPDSEPTMTDQYIPPTVSGAARTEQTLHGGYGSQNGQSPASGQRPSFMGSVFGSGRQAGRAQGGQEAPAEMEFREESDREPAWREDTHR